MELMPVILLVCSDFMLTESIKDPDLVCPSKPIGAAKSEDVILPCHVEPPMDASAETVKWKQGKHVVHLHQGGEHRPSEQWERFKGRTSLSSEGLTEGNLSLTLSSVNVQDDGGYQCSLHTESMTKSCDIMLSVEQHLVCPSDHIEVTTGEDVVLPCVLETQMDASGKTVKWTQGNNIVYLHEKGKSNPAGQKEIFKGRTSLFPEGLAAGNLSLTISSVHLRDNGKYLCYFITESIEKNCSVFLTVDEEEVVGSREPVTVEVGHDVILPCHMEPSYSLANQTLEWKLDSAFVHIYRSQKDVPEMQDERFKNRTSLFHEELVHGNISLKLINVTKEDAGNYSCFVPKLQGKVKKANVTLNVVNIDKCTCPVPAPKKDKTDQITSSCDMMALALGLGLGLGLGLPLSVCTGIIVFLCMKYVRRAGHEGGHAEQVGENDNNQLDVI